ncbi:MAG: methyl-accepting chemotaxis protein, partial [Thermodesulfobacteriota bacterium]|nr:methyl-accepting chemotaxis protein [Thermodesulfobacteriota bacterium]
REWRRDDMVMFGRFSSASLRFKIFFGLLLSLVPVMAIVGVSYYSARNTALRNSEGTMRLLTHYGAKEINGFIKTQKSLFMDWTEEDLFGLAIEFQTTTELKKLFQSMLEGQQGFSLLVLADVEGKVLEVALGEGIEGIKAQKLMGGVVKGISELQSKTGRYGRLVESGLTQALGQGSVSTYRFSFSARDSEGKENGFFLAYMDLSALQATVRAVANEMQTSVFPNARVGVVDIDSGLVLGHSNEEMIGNRLVVVDALKAWLEGTEGREARKFDLEEGTDYVNFASLTSLSGLLEEDTSAQGEGTLRFAAFVPEKDIMSDVRRIAWTSIGIAAVGTVVIVLIGLFISVNITRPVSQAVAGLKDIAEGEGDLTTRLEVGSHDEVGELAQWFNTFIQNLQGIVKDIAGNAKGLNTSSSDLSSLSAQMASSAEEMTLQSDGVAGAAEEMSANINTIATATEQMSANVQSVSSTAEEMSQNVNAVASSIEEMSMTLSDVASSAREGSDVAGKAMEMSNAALETMNVLGRAAKDIGEVTALIKRIAEQTNLLALNATIEAASAGDAGKGFAVVANEIKELANQSAQAAEDIAKRIGGVQTNTEEAVKVIADISGVINKINESSMVITNSVEQQKLSANEISGNVHQTSTGINNIASSIAEVAKGANDMARGAAEAAKGVTEVSSNIQEVSRAAGDSNRGAQQVSKASKELATVATVLQNLVNRFKV